MYGLNWPAAACSDQEMTEPITLPTMHSDMFDPPRALRELRATQPIARMRFADGHLGWLVTDHATACAILADKRFSSRQELRHMPLKSDVGEAISGQPAKPGIFPFMDPPAHTRYRRLLAGQFTVRRTQQLSSRIEEIVAGCLDAMAAAGPPTDLVQAFALPIPSLVICEMLGVPYSDRERFQRDTNLMQKQDHEPKQERIEAIKDLLVYVRSVVLKKKANPSDDIISGLIELGELSDDEITGMVRTLLVGGHQTVANMLGIAVFALLQNPDQHAAFAGADDTSATAAIEELLRYVTIVHTGSLRVALEDVELNDVKIKEGETVSVSLSQANRDPDRYPDPDTLNVTRDASGHIAFGYGVHQCLGQQLARIELRIGLVELFRRFPDLRLAVPAEKVPLREEMIIYGVHELPVTW
jgi:cytochrome P450